jgi:hypothetical protein
MKRTEVIIALMLLASIILPMTVYADADTEMGVSPELSESGNYRYTIGDTFDITIYLNPGGETVTAWVLDHFLFNTSQINVTDTTIEGFWDTGFHSEGSWNNMTGEVIDSQSFDMSGTTENKSAVNISTIATGVGECYLIINQSQVEDGSGPVIYHTVNSTIWVHPQSPTGLSADSESTSNINITWTASSYSGVDRYVLYGSIEDYPTVHEPLEELLNTSTLSTSHYNHTGLGSGETWYYTLYGYNTTENMYSILYQQSTETTSTPNASPVLSSPLPSNTTDPMLSYRTTQTVSITINDAEGDTITGYINCSGDSQAISGGNGTYSNSLSGLSAGTYTWWVNISDGSNTVSEWFQFRINTKPSGGGGGGGYDPSPSNGAPSVSISSPLSVNVTDDDGDDVTVKFYWQDGTQIGSDQTIIGGGPEIVSVSPTLSHDTEYFWYVTASDDLDMTTSDTWSFNTSSLGININAEWSATPSNNTIYKWVNITNTGSENLTNVDIWDRPSTYLSLDSYNHAGDYSANGHHQWTIPYLNYTGENTYYNITMWFSFDDRVSWNNNQCFHNLVNVSHLGQTDSVNLTGLCYSFTATKTANVTFVNETQTEVGWTIEIENTGDFTLNNVYINETYDDCVNYSSSTITPENPGTDTIFLISSIAPSATSELTVNISVTSGCPENGTRIYNNATVNTTEMTEEISLSEYVPYGGYTERIRVDYNIQINDMNQLGFTMQAILGILLIVGAILLIIGMMYRSGYLGGGEGQ